MSYLISCIRFYKHRFSRKSLETLYRSFVLPIFDYADVLYDNCSQTLSDQLESLHLDSLRTIIGAVRGTSHQIIYKESGFVPLQERRRRHKIVLFFKMVNGLTPAFLDPYLPPLVSSINPYHRRRPLERFVPRCRTVLYQNSFFPSTTQLWNNLLENIQSSQSISVIKRFLAQNDIIPPPRFYAGDRHSQILHCRLRNNISDLNQDLVRRHLSDNPLCACGENIESADHFLLRCTRYNNIRAITIYTLPIQQRDSKILLFGSDTLTLDSNIIIFQTVHARALIFQTLTASNTG